jgi:hypothetical protein
VRFDKNLTLFLSAYRRNYGLYAALFHTVKADQIPRVHTPQCPSDLICILYIEADRKAASHGHCPGRGNYAYVQAFAAQSILKMQHLLARTECRDPIKIPHVSSSSSSPEVLK